MQTSAMQTSTSLDLAANSNECRGHEEIRQTTPRTARRTERGYGVPPARLAWGSPASPAQSTSRAFPLQLVGHQPSGPLGRLAKVLIAVMGDVEEQVVVHRDSVIDGC